MTMVASRDLGACVENEVYDTYGSGCLTTCDYRRHVIKDWGASYTQKCFQGCFYESSFFLSLSSGKCIKPSECKCNLRQDVPVTHLSTILLSINISTYTSTYGLYFKLQNLKTLQSITKLGCKLQFSGVSCSGN
ncbi:hypothetical protein L596_021556 [Steinernema carpocapsae]|uniref:TIL domain-containing protein n=1 Tax=Steinernema carpocapsae TaxID=34508 RepID=A0A4U5MJ58_STECR|nr:hypothetical protein L596_021556 [Steinernema carpocapsae]